jgi:hypothetical protein
VDRFGSLASSKASGTDSTFEITPPSTCISADRLPLLSTSMKVGANIPGIEAEAINTRRNRSRRAGCSLAAIAVMFQITARWASRLVVTTNRKRPLRCSTAMASSSASSV